MTGSSRYHLLSILVVVVVVVSHCKGQEESEMDMPPVAPMIPTGCNSALLLMENDERFSIFKNAVMETGMDSVLGSIRLRATVFLPDNEAIKRTFSEIKGGQTADGGDFLSPEFLLRDYETLTSIVKMHILPMYHLYESNMLDYGNQCYETMVSGQCLEVLVRNNTVVLPGRNDMEIALIDELKDMGGGCPTLMHGINGMLIPPDI